MVCFKPSSAPSWWREAESSSYLNAPFLPRADTWTQKKVCVWNDEKDIAQRRWCGHRWTLGLCRGSHHRSSQWHSSPASHQWEGAEIKSHKEKARCQEETGVVPEKAGMSVHMAVEGQRFTSLWHEMCFTALPHWSVGWLLCLCNSVLLLKATGVAFFSLRPNMPWPQPSPLS